MARWWLNRDYVARVLCVNRDKPMSVCGGKCHLAKQLKAADDAEQRQQPVGGKQVFEEIQLFCASVEPLRFSAPPTYPAAAPRYAALRVAGYHWDRPGPDHPPARG